MTTPCEKALWKIIPTIRKELADILVKDFKLTQKEAARKLRVTEAAISQYLKSKRGSNLKFSAKARSKIFQVAKKIATEKQSSSMVKLYVTYAKL